MCETLSDLSQPLSSLLFHFNSISSGSKLRGLELLLPDTVFHGVWRGTFKDSYERKPCHRLPPVEWIIITSYLMG